MPPGGLPRRSPRFLHGVRETPTALALPYGNRGRSLMQTKATPREKVTP